MFRAVSMSELSQWRSTLIFLTHRSASLLNSFSMRIAQSKTTRYESPLSVSLNLQDHIYYSLVASKALLVLCSWTALPISTSYTTDGLHALGSSNLTRLLTMWCCWLHKRLLKYVQYGRAQTYIITKVECIYWEAGRNVSRLNTQNALNTRHIRYEQTESPSTSFLEFYIRRKPIQLTNGSTWEWEYSTIHCKP